MGTKQCFVSWLLGFLLLNILFLSRADVHYYDFVVQEANFTKLCSTKSMLTVNGSFPGPEIRVHRGDTVFVNVHNQGNYGLTIHWHGVKQPRNPWSDGPEYVTQCPIQPATNFTYEVILSDEIGTLWWHAHSDWTRATVHGAFVILPSANETYPFLSPVEDHTIILASWFKGDVKQLIDTALAAGTVPNISDAYTINGQPGNTYGCPNDTTYSLQVEYGNTYLLRIINAVMNEPQFFGITNHSLTVVGQDAAYVQNFTTNYIMIAPGQVMDVLVTADQNIGRYYMVTRPFVDGAGGFLNNATRAIFEYRDSDDESEPLVPPLPNANDTTAALNFISRLRFLNRTERPIDVPKIIDTRIYITVSTNQLPCNGSSCARETKLAASLNNVSFVAPNIDILQAYYSSISGVFTKDFPLNPPNSFNYTGNLVNFNPNTTEGTKAFTVNYGEAVEIVWQATNLGAGGSHPLHLHGFSFYLVGTGLGNFNNETDPNSYNLTDPPEINTALVPAKGWTAIRFFARNPGVWFMHCHLERHSSWGMDTVLIVKNGTTVETSILPPPPYPMPSCPGS